MQLLSLVELLSEDAESTIETFKLTHKTYEEKYGEKFASRRRFTPSGDTGGQGKDKVQNTRIQNLVVYFLKRPDVDLLSSKMIFTKNMYISKRNKSAAETQEGNQGDRERKAFTDVDQERLDKWMTRPLSEVPSPEDLQIRVATIILESTSGRGVNVVNQIRRSYVLLKNDSEGRPIVRIRGNVVQKTMRGRSADYKPIDKEIHGEFEVSFLWVQFKGHTTF